MDNSEVTYRFETNEHGESVLLEMRPVSLSEVTLSQDEDGIIEVERKVTETQAPADPDAGDKYTLRPEGALFRLVAKRSIPGITFEGARGGLVDSPDVLSHEGHCWIAEGSRVTDGARVTSDALVLGPSTVSGRARIRGHARVYASRINGHVTVDGYARVDDSTVDGTEGAVALSGTIVLDRGLVRPANGDSYMSFAGGCVSRAAIRNQYELVSFFDRQFGWCDAFRDHDGDRIFSIGCQRIGSVERLREVAQQHQVVGPRMLMLEAFIALADAAASGWHSPPINSGEKDEESDDD